jgi:two-component system cell cycle response regulator
MAMDDWKSRKHSLRPTQPVRGQPCLLLVYAGVMDSPEVGSRFDLVGEELIIGRSSDADIQVDRESVSRRHARLSHVEGGWQIADLQSTNGTYVNDEAARERQLADGDYLKIGNAIFRYFAGPSIVSSVQEELYRVAVTCGLTQTYKRRYFVDLLERDVALAQHYGRALSLVALDIDSLKQVNETHGHLTGDQVIKELARRTLLRIDRFEVLARYEGSQFLLLLPECDSAQALARAEELRHAICTETVRCEDELVTVSVSAGVATLDSEADAAGLIRSTQEAVQRAKKAGRNRTESKAS